MYLLYRNKCILFARDLSESFQECLIPMIMLVVAQSNTIMKW